MRKYIRIGGTERVYDTRKAALIGRTTRTAGSEDTELRVDLYRKRNGEFFLHLSAVNPSDADKVIHPIKPIGYTDAQYWACKCGISDSDMHLYFGADAHDGRRITIDDEDKRACCIYIPYRIHDTIRANAQARGISISQYVSGLVISAIARDIEPMPEPVQIDDDDEFI